MAGRWRSRTLSLIRTTCRHSSLTTARRAAGGGGAWCAGPSADAERSRARGTGSCRLEDAVGEGSDAQSAGSSRRRSGALRAGSRAFAGRSGDRGAGSRRRHSALKLWNRRRRSLWTPRKNRCGCVAASTGYTGRRASPRPSMRGSYRYWSALGVGRACNTGIL